MCFVEKQSRKKVINDIIQNIDKVKSGYELKLFSKIKLIRPTVSEKFTVIFIDIMNAIKILENTLSHQNFDIHKPLPMEPRVRPLFINRMGKELATSLMMQKAIS